MRTITYNDEPEPWTRSNHLIKTRLLCSNDDNNNFSGTGIRTETMTNQATPVTGTV
jgi:hypothetical protein